MEATGTENTELMINITTPHTKMAIIEEVCNRVNVVPGDATELIVRRVGCCSLIRNQVKGGRKLIFSGHTFSMAKLEKADKEKDAIENWSKERAETVAKANRRISFRDLNTALASFSDRWSSGFSSGSSGIWVFNPRFQCYTFLPYYFGWGSWGSTTAALISTPLKGYGSEVVDGWMEGVYVWRSKVVGQRLGATGGSAHPPSTGGITPVYIHRLLRVLQFLRTRR